MLLVQTHLAASAIHGLGVFATAPIADGEAIWRFEPELDLVIPEDRLPGFPPAFRRYLDMYAYRSVDLPDGFVLSCDHAKFFNHADPANTILRPFVTHAARDIAAGEEITCDYGAFCVGWTGFDGA